jgi:hypothetical protein
MSEQERETVNAKITNTMLGVEDHGILTFYVTLEWRGGTQSLGGFALDQYNGEDKDRLGFGAGLTAIRKILETVGVERWEQLKGQLVRAKIGTLGSWDQPIIGNIMDERWFDLKAFIATTKESGR